MKVVCLQFAPALGAVEQNIAQAEKCLSGVTRSNVDWLILPELAFSGYNFSGLDAIRPYLEDSGAGCSTTWARNTARRLECLVTVGYPERQTQLNTSSLRTDVDICGNITESCYNASVTLDSQGKVVAHYRKSFLYETDETWALEGSGFYAGNVDIASADITRTKVAHGICMDINPYKFVAPWESYEFANHVIQSGAAFVILSTAWLTLDPVELDSHDGADTPHWSTLSYWIERFRPVIDQDKEVIVAIANRCGTEGSASYAGTSTVLRMGCNTVSIWGVLGRGEEACLMIDTSKEPSTIMRIAR